MNFILFIIYLNVLAIMMKLIGDDSFLKDIPMLMSMDDTVLFGRSREMIVRKFTTLMVFCERYGMVCNEVQTNLMVINRTFTWVALLQKMVM